MVSEAQKRAQKKYDDKNREKTRLNNYRRSARLFVRKYATREDMEELIKIFEEKK